MMDFSWPVDIAQRSLPTHFFLWMHHYGSIVIFFWLALGIVALPIPEESLLILLGLLIAKGKLPLISTVLAVYTGSCCGISASYGLGLCTSHYLKRGWGRPIGLTEKRFLRAHNWFERVGKWALFIGYFIPGVRHLTGYVSGAFKLSYYHFALYAYAGAIVWTNLFMTIGYFFPRHWHASAVGLGIHSA